MGDLVLAVNAGSSSVKLGLYEADSSGAPELLAKGMLKDVGDAPRFVAHDRAGFHPRGPALAEGRRARRDARHRPRLDGGAGRRGPARRRGAPRRLRRPDVRRAGAARRGNDRGGRPLDAVGAPAPAPQSAARPGIACAAARPAAGRVFRHGLPSRLGAWSAATRFPAGSRRLASASTASTASLTSMWPTRWWRSTPRSRISARWSPTSGRGRASARVQHGRSLDTTMGFSALEGLVMGTRCGALDPGVILYLLKEEGLSANEVERTLYHESGLLACPASRRTCAP